MRRAGARGAAAIETAVALPFLVLFLAAAVDHAWLALVQHQMGHAARQASRYGITGQGADAPPPEGVARVALCEGSIGSGPRVEQIRARVAAAAGPVLKPQGLCLELGSYSGFEAVRRPEPFVDVNGNGRWDPGEPFLDINGNGQWDPDQVAPTPGGSDHVAIYTLRYSTRAPTGLTPGLGRARMLAFETRVVVRNEPW